MSFDPRTVGPRIRMLLPELTASEARITEIMLRSDGDAALPLKGIAQEADTSEAMVVKTPSGLDLAATRSFARRFKPIRASPTSTCTRK